MNFNDTITDLYSHNLWANLKLLAVCAALTEAQLDSKIIGAYGSIRETFEHITFGELGYLARISTGTRYIRAENAPPLTMAEMQASLEKTGTGFIEWAPKVQATDTVQIDWDGTPRDLPKTVLLTQVINHATEHRAQIMVMLTQLGIEPPELDSWAYFDERTK